MIFMDNSLDFVHNTNACAGCAKVQTEVKFHVGVKERKQS